MLIRVYGLVESDTGALRYVGVTKHPLAKRLAGHLKEAEGRRVTRKLSWIRAVLDRGAKPLIVELDRTDENDWQAAEQNWIEHLRGLGCELTNGTAGGYGVIDPTPEERARRAEKFRETMTGRPKPWAWGPRTLSDESRRRMREAQLARPPRTAEQRQRFSEAAKARWERTRARDGKLCECRRCVVGRANPRAIAAKNRPRLPKKSNHTRYHTNRGVIKEDCFYCKKS